MILDNNFPHFLLLLKRISSKKKSLLHLFMLGLSGSLPLSTQLLSQYHIIKIVFLVCFAYFSSTILLRSDFCISKHNVRINTLQKLKIKCFSVSYSEFTNDRWLCSAFKLCIWINDLSGNRHIHFSSHPTGQK